MEGSKQIKVGAVFSYLSIAINILSGLIYTPWMIQQIGQSQYGLFTLAHSLITLFLIDFGLSSATTRYVSKYRAENNQDKVDAFLGAIYKLYLVIDLVILIVLVAVYFFLETIYAGLTAEELHVFKIVYIISASFSVLNFPFVTLNGILTAYEKFIQLKLADVIYRILVVAMMVFALLNGMGIYALVSVNAIAGIAITLYKLIIIKKTTPVHVDFSDHSRYQYKDILGFSVWVMVSSLAQRLIFNITPSILGYFADSSAIAVFGVVTAIEGYTYTFTNAINGMFMPRISKLYAVGNSEDSILRLMTKVGRFQYGLNGLIVCGFACVGKLFISLWVGDAYKDAYLCILLVIIPGLFYNSLQIANTAMIVKKKVNIQACITLITGIVNVILSMILSPTLGVVGACISIFIAFLVRAVICNIVYYKVLRINIPVFIKQCYVGMLPCIIVTIALSFIINRLIPYCGWFGFLTKAIICTVVYLTSVFVIGLNKDEKNMIMSKLHFR